MINKETMVYIGDNSGARRAKIIGFLGSFVKKTATVNESVIVAIPKRRVKRLFISKNIYSAKVVTVKKNIKRPQGFCIKCAFNKVVLITDQEKVVGTRLFGPILAEMKLTKISKILTLSKSII